MTYAISDIHGEYELFMRLLDKIGFSKRDTLYICGDIVEKGPQSIRLARCVSQMPNCKSIAGNHEYAFLKYYYSQARQFPVGSQALLKKLKDYFPEDGELLDWQLIDWFESLPFYIEEDEFICVHAGAPTDICGRILPLKDAFPEQLVYDRVFKEPKVLPKEGRCVFFGHTPSVYLTGGESRILTYLREGARGDRVTDYSKIHLDVGTWITGTLGVFCIETCNATYISK